MIVWDFLFNKEEIHNYSKMYLKQGRRKKAGPTGTLF